jgi:hypothetical protein
MTNNSLQPTTPQCLEQPPIVEVSVDPFQQGLLQTFRELSHNNRTAPYGANVIFFDNEELDVILALQYLGEADSHNDAWWHSSSELSPQEKQRQIATSLVGLFNANQITMDMEKSRSNPVIWEFARSIMELKKLAETQSSSNSLNNSQMKVLEEVQKILRNAYTHLGNSSPSFVFANLLVLNYYKHKKESETDLRRPVSPDNPYAKYLGPLHTFPPQMADLQRAGLMQYPECVHIIEVLNAHPELLESKDSEQVQKMLLGIE